MKAKKKSLTAKKKNKPRKDSIFTLGALKGYYASFASHQGVLASLWGGQVETRKAFKTIKKPKRAFAFVHADELRNPRKVGFRPKAYGVMRCRLLFIHFVLFFFNTE